MAGGALVGPGLTLVFDHRANDGMQAAQLLASVVELLEHPERLEVSHE